MNRPSVLILAPDAEEYLSLLDGLSRQGTRLRAASSADRPRASIPSRLRLTVSTSSIAAAVGVLQRQPTASSTEWSCS